MGWRSDLDLNVAGARTGVVSLPSGNLCVAAMLRKGPLRLLPGAREGPPAVVALETKPAALSGQVVLQVLCEG